MNLSQVGSRHRVLHGQLATKTWDFPEYQTQIQSPLIESFLGLLHTSEAPARIKIYDVLRLFLVLKAIAGRYKALLFSQIAKFY
jgi:hypothetical protein